MDLSDGYNQISILALVIVLLCFLAIRISKDWKIYCYLIMLVSLVHLSISMVKINKKFNELEKKIEEVL
jgi:cell division protein FtsL